MTLKQTGKTGMACACQVARVCAAAVWLAGIGTAYGQFYFEAGPWARGGMDLKVEGGSRAAGEGGAVATPGIRGSVANAAIPDPGDDGSAQTLRTFDDGFVGPSGWQWASDLGLTQYFAYDRAAQYNAAANTLTFTRAVNAESTARRTETVLRTGTPGWRGADDLDEAGLMTTLGYTLWKPERFDVSLQLQAGWLGGMDSTFRGESTWRQEAESIMRESYAAASREWTYVYDTLGNPLFPTAPYEMTDPSGVGPMISDRPTEILSQDGPVVRDERVVGRSRKTATSRVDLDVDLDALVLTLGPRLRFRALDRVSLLVEGGVTGTLLDADLVRNETLSWDDGRTIRSWRDSDDEQKWLWGGTISAGLEVGLTERLTLSATGGYDWTEDCRLAVGPDRIDVDLDGWRATLSLGWSFGPTR